MTTRPHLLWLALLSAGLVPATCMAQAFPSGSTPAPSGPSVGFQLPTVGGSLQYGITASELLSTGFYQNSGTSAFTNIGGNLGYVSKSEYHPFSAIYSGGYLITNTNSPSTFYQNLSFSQVLSTKRWSIVASDAVSYLPSGPTLGLSGVAGAGDLGIAPVQVSPLSGLGILTNYGPRVSNATSLSVSRRLTGHLSAQGSGSLTLLRFIGENSQYGLSTTGVSGSGGLAYAFNPRSTLNGTYSFTHYGYGGTPFAFNTHSGTIGYSRQLRRDLSFSVFAGPQIAVSTQTGLDYTSSVGLTAGANLGFQTRLFHYALSYSRGISGGSGVIAGAVYDNAALSASHQFGRSWNTSGSFSYTRSTSLPQLMFTPFNSNALALGVQVNRSLSRTLSAYGSYSVVRQGVSGPSTVNTFSGLSQVVGFGLTYSPAPLNLGRR